MIVRTEKLSTKIAKLALLNVLLAIIAFILVITIEGRHQNIMLPTSEVVSRPKALTAHSRILIAGDTFWGRYIRDASMASDKKYAFPFSGLHTLGRENYDAWLSNLECPVTDNSLTSAQQEATLTFNCRPEFLPEAAKWLDVVSLANNHTDNMGGQAGLDETRSHLEENGIQYYGHYDNAVKDDDCEVVSIPINIDYTSGGSQKGQLPVAMCGYHGVFKVPTADELDVISKYSKYFLTIVTPHMGAEYKPSADELKTATYRAMIDRGADMVVASHPHWVQNTEVYKGKLILYSLGNFMFDQQDTDEVRRSAALDLTINMNSKDDVRRWLSGDFECTNFKDDCLEHAAKLKLAKPNFSLDYGIVATLNTKYVTSLAPENVRSLVLKRLNWDSTLQKLKSANTLVD